ncbi:uncharacterized protein LOC135586932 isoform X1 [Musa acuminata AAA Group]|uniref:uncharacterized protein LOC135586932 isoform X1 n=1 Tax=Musa acuminata AAA Group TaxID=214697 RepID=UPI0031E3793D
MDLSTSLAVHYTTFYLGVLLGRPFLPSVNSDHGEKKLAKVIVPDKWKEGASNTTESGGRKINENKLLSRKNRWTPYGNTKCIICKQQVHQDAKYCHTCAYSKGVCAMCGKQVLDTKLYKQSNV